MFGAGGFSPSEVLTGWVWCLCRSELARERSLRVATVCRVDSVPSPQPSPGGRGGRSAWADSSASAGEFVGRITVRGYAPLAVPPRCPVARLLVGASLLANEPRSGVCSRASSLLRRAPHPSPLPEGEGAVWRGRGDAASAGEFVGRITVRGYAPLAGPPGCPVERLLVGASLLANEPRSGVCSRASSLLRRAPSPASGRGG